MITKILVVAAALTTAVVVSAPAQADTNFSIGVGLGLGGFGGGYEPGYYPVYGGYYSGVSCGEARQIVKSHGFHKVHATNCSGKIMKFKGKQGGIWHRIKVNRAGNIVDVDMI
jgi:hypothetical protein